MDDIMVHFKYFCDIRTCITERNDAGSFINLIREEIQIYSIMIPKRKNRYTLNSDVFKTIK